MEIYKKINENSYIKFSTEEDLKNFYEENKDYGLEKCNIESVVEFILDYPHYLDLMNFSDSQNKGFIKIHKESKEVGGYFIEDSGEIILKESDDEASGFASKEIVNKFNSIEPSNDNKFIIQIIEG